MPLGKRRAIGIGLASASLVAAFLLLSLNPLPVSYEAWARGESSSVLLMARGPAIARYDAGTDTTVAVFQCDHGYCDVATQIEGNATDAVRAAQIVLFSPEGATERADVDLAQPIEVPASDGSDGQAGATTNVTRVTALRFELGRAWLPLLMYQLVFLAAVVGVLLVFRATDPSLFAGALGVGAGMLVGAQFAAGGPDRTIGALIVLALGACAGILAWRLFPRSRWGRPFAVAGFAFAAAIVFSMLVTIRYFAHAPTM